MCLPADSFLPGLIAFIACVVTSTIGFTHRKCSRSARPQFLRRGLHAALDILRIVIPSTDDDEILQATADEELSGVKEAQVSGAQVSLARLVRQSRAKVLDRLLFVAPVPARLARRMNPDLPDFAFSEMLKITFRIRVAAVAVTSDGIGSNDHDLDGSYALPGARWVAAADDHRGDEGLRVDCLRLRPVSSASSSMNES